MVPIIEVRVYNNYWLSVSASTPMATATAMAADEETELTRQNS